ncbi:MAG: hypothetical protein ACYC61_19350 [Isosphaeraceae bacterium]
MRLPPKPFAVGGEGAVFDVHERPDVVANLYSRTQNKDRCDKLRAMARLSNPELLKIAAWPTATLSTGNGASVDGILMPRIADYLEIHHLYSVAQRKKDFPEKGWDFLLHTARNCAIAFESVHEQGHVVGDVNQKNVMVSRKGIVAFVDCDSFQVAEGSRVFRCGVGVPEYTPPELQGKNFASLDRSANHDQFGLAVLVFHLLMMGRHPFSGVPLAQADIPMETAIKEGSFAYMRNTAATRLRPPPHVPPAAMLGPALLDLFERAFCTPRRPTATEWRASLDAAMKQLVPCENDRGHAYLKAAGSCPWCELIAVARLMFFLPSQGASTPAFRPDDIEQLITKLSGISLIFDAYVRPRPRSPVVASLPGGLRAVKKPVPVPYPAPPPPVQKPVLVPLPIAPLPLPSPTLIPRPVRPQPAARPPLAPLPLAPAPLPRPQLIPLPSLPEPAAAPLLTPLPIAPASLPKPPLIPQPARPHPAARPPLAPHPDDPEVEPPALKPRPPAPPDPPPPRLKSLPAAPDHPQRPQLGPPDRFLVTVCKVGLVVGILVLIVAPPVGLLMVVGFAAWWLIMVATEGLRREMALRALERVHQIECDRIDQEYAAHCRLIEEANHRWVAAWQAAQAAQAEQHARARKKVNDANTRLLRAFETAKAAALAEHRRQCREIDAGNSCLLAAWESMNAALMAAYEQRKEEVDSTNHQRLTEWEGKNTHLQAHHQRACTEIEAKNQEVISAWKAADAAREAEYQRDCEQTDLQNRQRLVQWDAANASIQARHQGACKEMEARNQEVISAWEAMIAAREAEYQRECHQVDVTNRLMLMGWETENTRRQVHHQRTCREIEAKNRELTADWEAFNAARKSEHERVPREIDEENERAIAAWKVANAPWLEEEGRWRQRLAAAEAERDRLESGLHSQRSASRARFDTRKKQAQQIVSSHYKVRLEYRRELQQAETGSKKIQLEEYLDQALIRDAKIKGMSGKCILALESYGIETAKDVELLKTQKVPGIGGVLWNRLFDWREEVERAFVLGKAIPESERSRIASRYAPVYLSLGQTVQSALHDLEVLTSSHRARERELVMAIEAAVQNVAVAEAHLEALKKLL